MKDIVTDILVVIGKVALVVGIAVVLLTGVYHMGYAQGWAERNNKTFNEWVSLCHHDGGNLQLVNADRVGDSYECYKGGKIIDHLE